MALPLKDRIRADYATLLDSFASLVKAARVNTEQADGGRAQAAVPGEVLEVFAEKMLQAASSLLSTVAELKRHAALNDFASRNAAVGAAGAELRARATALRGRAAAAGPGAVAVPPAAADRAG